MKIEKPEWIVDRLIPAGHLCVVLSQAGVGKSLIMEYLATCIAHSAKFCGFDTIEGNTLIIDQDTPQNAISSRLIRFSRGIGKEPKHILYLKSMCGYQIKDRTLFTAINDFNTKLTLIDTLHSTSVGLNINSVSDMSKLSTLKEKCLKEGMTIIFNHHISEKDDLPIKALMTGDPHKLSMGSSAIIQQADTYYIIGAYAENGRTNRIYIRTISKRLSIPMPPIVVKIVATENGGEMMEFDGNYEPELDEIEQDIMVLFRDNNTDRTVKEIYEAMGHKHGEVHVREALTTLDKKGKLSMSRHRSNLFKYRMP